MSYAPILPIVRLHLKKKQTNKLCAKYLGGRAVKTQLQVVLFAVIDGSFLPNSSPVSKELEKKLNP